MPKGGGNPINPKRVLLVLLAIILVVGMVILMPQHRTPDSENKNNVGRPDVEEDNLTVYALDLERPLTPAEKSELAGQVDWMDELNGETLLVRIGAKQKQVLESLLFIKSISKYQPEQKIQEELQDENAPAKENTATQVIVTVTLADADDKPHVIELIKSLDGNILDGSTGKGRYLKIELPASKVTELADSPRVLYVEKYDRPDFLNDRIRDIVGARPLAIPNFTTYGGLTGEGQTIGLADSGLDTGSMGNLHPDLESTPEKKPRVIMLKSWAGVETPADTDGHGTHMAGTLLGSGKASAGKYAGLAPNASLYFQGIVDNDNEVALPLDVGELFKPAYDADVRIHVNGWGNKRQNTYASTAAQVDEFVRAHPDFLAIFGAGNTGSQEGSLTAEANNKNALVVGASTSPRPAFENSTGDTEKVASFSSRGPAADGRIKPELVAPGTSVISTASRLVEGNLAGRQDYTIKQGTSMASAVAGGAAALLRQYYEEYGSVEQPSAALMKATLINGARQIDGETFATGFGLLDIGGTILALENQQYELIDNKKGIATGKSLTYQREITHSGAPFKATLAWTDPAAAPGARSVLVNNLDLIVVAPDGARYYGNDSYNMGVKDTLNNVEQVYIPHPKPGTYEIIVQGKNVLEDAAASGELAQDFALVFGQPLAREIVKGGIENTDEVFLSGGDQLALPADTLVAVDNSLLSGLANLPAGSELYLVGSPQEPERVYAVSRTWRSQGVKTLSVEDETVIVRVNGDYREGGYAVNRKANDAVNFNGHYVNEEQIIPPGASVTASINPYTQTIWRADITSQEVTGVLDKVYRENRQFELLSNQQIYTLAEDATISFSDIVVGGDTADLPFGASTAAEMENLLPGMPVYATLGSDGKVYHLMVKRHMILGRVAGIAPDTRFITLSSGDSYRIMRGMNVVRDQKPVEMEAVNVGDLAMLNLVPDTDEVLGVTLYSDVSYGQVLFVERDDLYLMDKDNINGFINLAFHPESKVFRWGMAAGTSRLSTGQWVRVIKDPVSGEVWRVDIAEAIGKIEGIMESYIPNMGIKTTDDKLYQLSSASVITKDGLPVRVQDLVPGEQITVTALYGPGGEEIVASLEAETRKGVKSPNLKVISTIPFEDFSLVTGKTNASRLYARYSKGFIEEVDLTESGEFYYSVNVEKANKVRLVAVDSATGGVTALWQDCARRPGSFSDIDYHWAEMDIHNLVSRGMLKGFPDGTFRPNSAVTRAEFIVMLTRLMGNEGSFTDLPYIDAQDVPEWARSSVAHAYNRGLVMGYDDNTFRPHAHITREEAASLMVRVYDIIKGVPLELTLETPVYADWGAVSDWARVDVTKARQLGLLSGKAGNRFDPKSYISRAETAATLNYLLFSITDEDKL